MARWKYELKCGKELRDAIWEDNCKRTLSVIEKAYKELLKAKLISKDDYESYTDEFILYDVDDLDDDDINYELRELYDLCDSIGVWIPIV